MTDTAQIELPDRDYLPALLIAAAAIGAVNAAAWFYFRNRQPKTDAITRERLQPRSRSAT